MLGVSLSGDTLDDPLWLEDPDELNDPDEPDDPDESDDSDEMDELLAPDDWDELD